MSLLSIIVPCFNEEDSIFLFHEAVIQELSNLPVAYEMIFINDGSSDQTLSCLSLIHI